MVRPLAGLALLGLAACAAQGAVVPLSVLLSGDLEDSARVEATAQMAAPGSGNIYALVESEGGLHSGQCVALILRHEDRPKARRLHGQQVRVRGSIIFLSDMTAMFPEQGGLIDGRSWSGTVCDGETVIFVSQLERAARPNPDRSGWDPPIFHLADPEYPNYSRF